PEAGSAPPLRPFRPTTLACLPGRSLPTGGRVGSRPRSNAAPSHACGLPLERTSVRGGHSRPGSSRMSQDRRWLLGGLAVVFGFVGLFLASRAGHGIFYWIGLIVFLAAVGTIFGFVRAAFDEAEGKAQTPQHLVPLTMLAVAVGSVVFHFLSPWWWSPIASNWGYIDQTIIITFWITGVAFTAIVVSLPSCSYRFGHQAGRRAAYEPESRRLEFWLTMGTAAGVVAMLAPGLIVWSQFVTVPEEAAEIEIVGQQWQWSFRYPGEDGRLGRSDTRLVSNDNPLGLDPNDPNGADDVVVQNVDLR